MTTPDQFDAWLERELSGMLPTPGPVPERLPIVAASRRWSWIATWLIPPLSGKLLVATTALAVAGTAGGVAAAHNHITLPLPGIGQPAAPAEVVSPAATAAGGEAPGTPQPPSPAGRKGSAATIARTAPQATRGPGTGHPETELHAPGQVPSLPGQASPAAGSVTNPGHTPEPRDSATPSPEPSESPEPRALPVGPTPSPEPH